MLKRLLLFATLTATTACAHPGHYYYAEPVYIPPPVVYYAPPTYYAPPQVYYRQPTYSAPRYYYPTQPSISFGVGGGRSRVYFNIPLR